jgi:hypothetical protein
LVWFVSAGFLPAKEKAIHPNPIVKTQFDLFFRFAYLSYSSYLMRFLFEGIYALRVSGFKKNEAGRYALAIGKQLPLAKMQETSMALRPG